MKWIFRLLIFILLLILFIGTILDQSQNLEVTRHRIGQEKGVGAGLRIAQISDLHIVGYDEIEERVIQEVNREDPDLVVFTGDILPSPGKMDDLAAFLDRLNGRSQKMAILGNWEYYARDFDVQGLRQFYASHHVTLLINEAVKVESQKGEQLLLVGMDDALMGKPNWNKAMMQQADWQGPTLVLAHNPAIVEKLPVEHSALADSVILTGHTHGGQIMLFGWTMKPTGLKDKRCLAGWCRQRGLSMYISRGIGTSIIPLRIGIRPELVFFEWVFHAF